MSASFLEGLAVVGIGANMTAMAWIMKTLFQLRQEISSAHADHHSRIQALERAVFPR